MKLSRTITLGLSVGAILLFSGCASKATMENMVYKSDTHQQYNPVLKEAVTIDSISGGHITLPFYISEIGDDEFKDAVKNSLIAEKLYSDNGRYKLIIEINDMDHPMFGLDMKVTLDINYRLIDSKTKMEVVNKKIISSYTATFSDAAMGIVRLRLANEGSGRESIKGLLMELSKLQIDPNEVSILK